jgi:predicted nucleic acid-binding protein
MKYLLDVNALVALAFAEHEFHVQVATWASDLPPAQAPEFATCAITELGLLRTLLHAGSYGFAISDGLALLVQLKRSKNFRFTFIADDHSVPQLPSWVKTARQTTDGHLAQLAKAHGAVLATLDKKMPGALLIPAAR